MKPLRVLSGSIIIFSTFMIGYGIGSVELAPTLTDTDLQTELEERTKERDDARSWAATKTPTAPVAPTETTIPGDGMFLVGSQVTPGQYSSSKTSSSIFCSWSRLSGTSGTLDNIIANGNETAQIIITIEPVDVAFKTTGCAPWTKIG